MKFLSFFKKPQQLPPTVLQTLIATTADLNKELLNLNSSEIIAILPYKYEHRDMRDSQVLTSVLVVYKG